MKWLILCIVMVSSFSQSAATEESNPCNAPIYHAFDFWLGQWEVYGSLDKTGPILGKNNITKTRVAV